MNPEIYNGSMSWYDSRNRLHREDGPAFISHSGDKQWLIHGITHREDGPAVIWKDNKEEWYLNNKMYETPEEMPLNLFLAYCRWEYNKNGN